MLMPACAAKTAERKPVDGDTEAVSSAEPKDDFDPLAVPGRIHVVQPNETLWSLSEKYYGHSKHWKKISTANQNRLKDPTNLPVGMKLIIP